MNEVRTAVITGASRGIGAGIAAAFAQAGYRLVLHASDKEHLKETLATCQAYGAKTVCLGGDIALPDTAKEICAAAQDAFGGPDILINNAGVTNDAVLWKLTDAQWERVLAVNLSASFFLMRESCRAMRKKKWGRIINIGSPAWQGNFGQSAYAASKAGLVGLTKTAALELGMYGITCNVVCPGFIRTDMTDAVPDAVKEAMLSRIPANRAGQPSDVAKVVLFLAGDDAAYITGSVIDAGGGFRL